MPDRDYTVTFKIDTTHGIAALASLKAEFQTFNGYINGLGGMSTQAAAQMTQLSQAMDTTTASTANVGKAAHVSMTSMLAMNGAMIAMQAGVQAIGTLGAMATAARDRMKELAVETMGLRDQMRELANLKGKTGPDNELVGETVKAGMKAGMMPDEMRKYLEQYEGSSPAGVQMGHIGQLAKDQLAIEGARFGNRVKLSPHTAGDLAGVISQYTDLTRDENGKKQGTGQQVEKAMSQMGRIAYGLNEGRGNLEPLVRSLINTAGAVVGGPVEDLAELAAIQGVASTHANPRESGTRVRQAVRALRDTSGPAGSAMKNIAKIDDTDTHLQRLEKLKPILDEAQKKGKGGDIAMREMGFSDDDEIRAIVEEVHDLDIIKQRIAKGKTSVTGASVMEANTAFQTKDRVGLRKQQLANKAGQEFLLGENSERVEMAKENAEQQLRQGPDRTIGGRYNDNMEWIQDLGGLKQWAGFEGAKEQKKFEQAEKNLLKEALRVGIPTVEAGKMLGLQDTGRTLGGPNGAREMEDLRSEYQKIEGYNKLATEVERKGGNSVGTGPDLNPKIDALILETKETNRLIAIQNQKGANPQPPQAQPPLPPARAAALPKRP
jgi:hypothetical protein